MNQREIEYFARKEQDARDDREAATKYCEHEVDGPRRNVTVDIEGSQITAILCADCELPIQLDPDLHDNFNYEVTVYATGVPMVLVSTQEWELTEPGFPEQLVDVFHELTAEGADL